VTTPLNWPLLPDPETPNSSIVAPSTAQEQAASAAARGVPSFIGRGIRRPFVRDQKNDFATAEGIDLIQANIVQAIGIKGPTAKSVGEVPWRTEMGSRLHILRLQNNRESSQAFAASAAQDAVRQWEPRARVTRTTLERLIDQRKILVRSKFEIVEPTGRVIAPDLEAAVPVTTAD
jgi:phage baseplate assembly protein W